MILRWLALGLWAALRAVKFLNGCLLKILNVHEDIDFSVLKTIEQNWTIGEKTLRREVSKATIGTYRFTT